MTNIIVREYKASSWHNRRQLRQCPDGCPGRDDPTRTIHHGAKAEVLFARDAESLAAEGYEIVSTAVRQGKAKGCGCMVAPLFAMPAQAQILIVTYRRAHTPAVGLSAAAGREPLGETGDDDATPAPLAVGLSAAAGREPLGETGDDDATPAPLCAKCGAERVADRPYCVKCGTKWSDDAPVVPASKPRAPNVWRWYRARRWWWQTAIAAGVLLVALIILASILPTKSTTKLTPQQAQYLAAAATANAGTAVPTFTAQQLAYTRSLATAEAAQTEQVAIAAEQTIAAEPTSTPVPAPHDLSLLSASCTHEYGFTTCEGSVRNDSGADILDVEAVVESQVNGVTRSSDEALIDFNPILSGQGSPWKVIFTYNPAYTGELVVFKTIDGRTLFTQYCKGAGGGANC